MGWTRDVVEEEEEELEEEEEEEEDEDEVEVLDFLAAVLSFLAALLFFAGMFKLFVSIDTSNCISVYFVQTSSELSQNKF